VRYSAILSLAAAVLLSCQGGPKEQDKGQKEMSPEKAAMLRRALMEWFEAEEATEGQLERVLTYGDDAVPSLAAALHRGPSPAQREQLRLHLVENYGRLQEYGRTHPEAKLDMTEAAYVQTYLDNYDALYRVRGATALGRIGTPAALEALRASEKDKVRDDVRGAVRTALAGR